MPALRRRTIVRTGLAAPALALMPRGLRAADAPVKIGSPYPLTGGAASAGVAVKQAIESCFAAGTVNAFLKSLERASLRIREFEQVLTAGKLGPDTAAKYAKLDNGDQGQIREFYLAKLEQVDLALRDKYFKLYAYY